MPYVSVKDDTNPQVILPSRWTVVSFNGKTTWTPMTTHLVHWAYYLNVINNPNTEWVDLNVRWSRDPKGLNDFTGQSTSFLRPGSHFMDGRVWYFKGIKGQPIGLMIKHNGTDPITLGTREFKMDAQ